VSHLLVVDDSPTIRKLVELTFRGSSWTLDFAACGRDGIRLAGRNAPDVILLDFVLPDMRGLEVCAKLAGDEETRSIPIVLMSAKDESVRQLFKPYASVVDFVPKPFTAEDLAARVCTAVEGDGLPRAGARSESLFGLSQKESAAKAIYAKLSKVFSHIPSWCAQMGAQHPAAFFARKILTPETVGSLLEALLPTFRELESSHQDAVLSGTVRGWPIADLCTMIGASARTGELRLHSKGKDSATIMYWRCGEIVLLTSVEPLDHTGCDGGELSEIAPDVVAAAEFEQRATGKPVHVTLDERGVLPRQIELGALLHRAGRRLLLEALDAKEMSFVWRDLTALPAYVEAHARRVPISRNTVPFERSSTTPKLERPTSLKQLALERMRSAPDPGPDAWPEVALVFDRAARFNDKVRQVVLNARERRVLALIDGRHSLEKVALRSGLELSYVRHIVRCLASIELVAADETTKPRVNPNGVDFNLAKGI
jgi:CheY-like chemotaxis protein